MKRQVQPHQDPSDTQTKKSCPTILEEDVTRSINESFTRNVKSQQFLPHYENDSVREDNDNSKRQSQISALKSSGFADKLQQESKIDVRIINQKGTDFDCQKVQSIELSIEQASYRSGSLKNRSNRNSQQQLEEPRSARKFKKQEKQKSSNIDNFRQNDIKQEVLNVLLAGAQDTGKSRFRQCFKGKQRKADEPHIKSRTREIKYEKMADQNLLNKRNNVCFIDLPGFACNQEDKYLRQIQQIATTQWRNFLTKSDDDKRIHCCLYFMRGPRIKTSDINMMKKLSSMFNLIPVIAKSDNYKKEQILEMKEQFHRKIAAAGEIELYDLEQYYLLKLGTNRIDQALYSNFGKIPPFAIASSTDKQKSQEPYYVRKYPWGKVQIQNEQHTDFKRLCDLLTSDIRTQFLAKMIPLPKRNEQESVEQIMGQIAGQVQNDSQVQNDRNEGSGFISKLKNVVVIVTLVAVAGGVWFHPKVRQGLMNWNKNVST